MAHKKGWGDEKVGRKPKVDDEIELDLDDADDDEMSALLDEIEMDLGNSEEDGDDTPQKPKKAAKATKKSKRRSKKPAPEDEDSGGTKVAKKKAKKATKKRAVKKAAKKATSEADIEDLLDELPDGDEPKKPGAKRGDVAAVSECPVCRSIDDCACNEDDRAFTRRTRFESDVETVSRCPRCGLPLSVLYVPRAGTSAPYDLSHAAAIYACVVHGGAGIATVAAIQSSGIEQED